MSFEPPAEPPSRAAAAPRARDQRPWRRRRGLRVGVRASIAAVSLLILLASGFAWAEFQNFSASVPHGENVPADLRDPDGKDQNILLVGNDTRAGATEAELKALHTGDDKSTANADTMMVLHIPANGSRPSLVSFPRDSWVSIPGHGNAKLNAAYPDGYNAAKSQGKTETEAQSAGLILTIKTLHTLTGLHIDHYMQVSLLGFYRISEAIGGVTVCLNAAQNPTTDADAYGHGYSGIDLPKGVSVIKGKQALAFVRQRHGLPHGDLDRIKRQQYFLKSAFQKIESAGTLLNPFKMRNLLKAVEKSLLTDPKLDLVSLAQQFESLSSGKITFTTIPNNGPKTIYPDGVLTSIVQINKAAIPAFIEQLEGKGDEAFKKAKPVQPYQVTVDVLNATPTARLAARNADQLKKLNFKIDNVDSTTTTPHTSVQYPPGKEAQAKTLLKAVPKAKAVETPDVSRVTLVLGTDGTVVPGVPTTKPAPSTSPAGSGGSTSAGSASSAKKPAAGLGCID